MKQPGEELRDALDAIDVTVNEANLSELLYTADETGYISAVDVDDAKRIYKMILLAQSYGTKPIPDKFRM